MCLLPLRTCLWLGIVVCIRRIDCILLWLKHILALFHRIRILLCCWHRQSMCMSKFLVVMMRLLFCLGRFVVRIFLFRSFLWLCFWLCLVLLWLLDLVVVVGIVLLWLFLLFCVSYFLSSRFVYEGGDYIWFCCLWFLFVFLVVWCCQCLTVSTVDLLSTYLVLIWGVTWGVTCWSSLTG